MHPTEITDQSFEQEVLKSETPVLVDFWAPWCTPCLMIAPALEELTGQYQGKIKVAKLNVDDNPEMSSRYQIMSIPNMKIFKKGKIVEEIVGVAPKQVIEEKIQAHI